MRAVLVLLLAGCTSTSSTTAGTTTSGACPPGIIQGDPSLEVGRGASEFIAVSDGETWTAANGPQGGSHLWLSIRTTGLGPDVALDYAYLELDGGVLATTAGAATLCAGPSPTTQEKAGLTAFLPDDSPTRHRLLCEGPFDLRVTVSSGGERAEQTRRVGRVEPDTESFIPFRLRCDAGVVVDAGP